MPVLTDLWPWKVKNTCLYLVFSVLNKSN